MCSTIILEGNKMKKATVKRAKKRDVPVRILG
jgi:hypothetical protein